MTYKIYKSYKFYKTYTTYKTYNTYPTYKNFLSPQLYTCISSSPTTIATTVAMRPGFINE